MTRKILTVLTIMLASSIGPVSAQQKVSRQIPVDKDFIETYVAYSGAPRAYTMKIKLINIGGKLELCGIGHYASANFRGNIKRGLRQTEFMVNGREVLNRMDFFSTVKRRGDLDSGTANCMATGVATPGRIDNIDINWGNFTSR